MGRTPSKLGELASGAGKWLALADAAPERHTTAVVADRFEQIAWRDTYGQSAGLRELAEELNERYDCTTDLLADTFLAAYKAGPRLRERAEMDPSRLVNHQVITALVESLEFAELRRETAGDPYAAAMAVLAQAAALRRMLERSRDAQEQAEQAKKAQQAAEGAATAVGEALQQAADGAEGSDGDGTVPAPAADAVQQAIETAQTAEAAAQQAAQAAAQALAAAAPGIGAAARNAAAKAAGAAREEAALMRAWGVDSGELERMPFDQRARLAERLRTSRLAQWAELIGRFRQMAGGERARRVENAAGELIGVTLGNDLSRVIPSELANLGLPELRAVFAARYAAGELMLYDGQGEQTTGRGAVIACVDTSHSMYEAGPGGVTREAWAKACALALLDQARHAGRDFVGILFSAADKLQVFRFPAGRPADVAQVLDFAETFLGGGTSYQTPLTAAGELLEEEFNDTARARGDIVMLTDDECGVTEEWMRGWNGAKRLLGFRVFGVAIGAPPAAEAGSVLDALCDNLRSIEDLGDVHAAADLFRVI
ncbi:MULTISPECIES: VWA domain-containing protein [unclassified Streptomyces]|uniref:VWA domain-containing protein n=1 Tax=unclassified Streptomyces TaxID=2593676 RepID=UPI002DD8C156|nr:MULTISPECIES: VWA domain-containing protein [unclassified Streptomyces]WSB79937.1 VWA domain-containing protein [Streptomyces sp. NBC_01775]WSS11855.1 VWA domain-containing protein [Streptomyces sp. NBC_01186]WSS40570.1 VWA domain-containing protein [Streptomyces sp. NBC_01187]